jgi:hypothetical protein
VFGSFKTLARRGAAVAALLALGACSGTSTYSRSQPGAEPAADKGNAIIVFGLNFRSPAGAAAYGDMTLYWASYDPASGHVLQRASFGAKRTCNDPRFDIVPDFCKRHETSYHTVEVKPGDYILSTAIVTAYHTRITNFHEMPTWTNWTATASVRSSRAPRVSVAAGEVVYIGDYYFFPLSFPVRLTGLEWNLRAAQAHFAATSKAPATLVERRPKQD